LVTVRRAVLELHAPHGSDLSALRTLVPLFVSYVLSFVTLGIYWNIAVALYVAVGLIWFIPDRRLEARK
jgi:uncharacterized membrane protein